MKTEMKVLLYLKRKEQTASGLCPLMGKITVAGIPDSTAQFGCKMSLDPKIWNATSQRCTGKSRAAITANRDIENLHLLLLSRFNELKEANRSVSAQDVKNAFQGIASAQVTLLGLFREHNDEYALRVGVNRVESSFYQYKNTYALLSQFVSRKYKVSDVAVKSLDASFIEAFDLFLRVEKRHQIGTIVGHIERVKRMATIAVHRGVITFSPFDDFIAQKPEQQQRYLTREELERLMTTTFDTPNRNFTRDMFLFSTFTGIGYRDLCNLTQQHISKAPDGALWIEMTRQKTGTPENVRLLDIAVKIMEKYAGMAPDGKLFPMLLNTSINPHLKKIAKQCGITRNLTFHMARHTFGSEICLSQGVPIETVSRIMGHRDIQTTQRYAKVTQEKIDHDVTCLHSDIENKYTLHGIEAAPSKVLKDRKLREAI